MATVVRIPYLTVRYSSGLAKVPYAKQRAKGKAKKNRRYSTKVYADPFMIELLVQSHISLLCYSVPASLPECNNKKPHSQSLTPSSTNASTSTSPSSSAYSSRGSYPASQLNCQLSRRIGSNKVPSVTSDALPVTLALTPPLRPPIRSCTPASRTLQVSASLAPFVGLVDTSLLRVGIGA